MRFLTRVKSKLYQISDKFVYQRLRYGVSDGTFEAKKDQSKFIIRTLLPWHSLTFSMWRFKIIFTIRNREKKALEGGRKAVSARNLSFVVVGVFSSIPSFQSQSGKGPLQRLNRQQPPLSALAILPSLPSFGDSIDLLGRMEERKRERARALCRIICVTRLSLTRHGCQMALPKFLDHMCLAVQA